MSEFDERSGKLTIKLVYYGPALSGKTTNLTSLHDRLNPQLIGDMMTLETKNDRTLFFDLLPLGFKTESGMLVKFKLYTVPGQVAHDSTRKAVLSRADGVVFVADSQRSQSVNNGESFENLVDNVARVGLNFDQLPLVVQFNKQDLPNILSQEEILSRWKNTPWPVIFGSALTGGGVVETFRSLLMGVYRDMDKQYSLTANHGINETIFIDAALGDVAG